MTDRINPDSTVSGTKSLRVSESTWRRLMALQGRLAETGFGPLPARLRERALEHATTRGLTLGALVDLGVEALEDYLNEASGGTEGARDD